MYRNNLIIHIDFLRSEKLTNIQNVLKFLNGTRSLARQTIKDRGHTGHSLRVIWSARMDLQNSNVLFTKYILAELGGWMKRRPGFESQSILKNRDLINSRLIGFEEPHSERNHL